MTFVTRRVSKKNVNQRRRGEVEISLPATEDIWRTCPQRHPASATLPHVT